MAYSLRHAGASNDIIQKRRSVLEVKLRGRWKSDSSLARYMKPARVLQQANLLPAPVLDYGKRVRSSLQDVFLGRVAPAAPPVK